MRFCDSPQKKKKTLAMGWFYTSVVVAFFLESLGGFIFLILSHQWEKRPPKLEYNPGRGYLFPISL